MANTIYLNNAASASPRAEGVAECVAQALESLPLHPGRAHTAGEDAQTECRRRLARLLGVEHSDRIVLATNATHALNLAILGASLGPGSLVVTTVTEHNSVLRPLHHLRERVGIEIEIIGLDERLAVDRAAFDRALRDRPSLVVVNHASNVTGRVNDVATLLAKAKDAGAVTLLDASQSLGHVPVRPVEFCADLVAFTGHKALHGPPGTGGLYVSPEITLAQVFVGGTGVRSDLVLHPPEMPVRLEAGTPDMPALGGLAAALRWFEQRGEASARRAQAAALRLRDGLRRIPGVLLHDDAEDVERTGVVSFAIAGWPVEEVGYIFGESFNIVCRTGLHCAPLIHAAIGSAPEGTIRFSTSGFNTEQEIEAALRAVSTVSTCGSSKSRRSKTASTEAASTAIGST